MAANTWGVLGTLLIATLIQLSAQRSFDCDFESACGLVQDSTDDLDWTRLSGSTPSSRTGPNSGHGGSGYYLYLEASFEQRGDSARLRTPDLSDDTHCAEFAYHMYGSSMGELSLYKEGPGSSRSVLWSESGDKGQSWMTYSTTVTLGPGYNKIGWEAVRGNAYDGDIAIDDIYVSPGACGSTQPDVSPCLSRPCQNGGVCSDQGQSYVCDCSSTGHSGANCDVGIAAAGSYVCDFETDVCGLVQDTTDNFDWTLLSGGTPSQRTGPDSGYQRSQSYIYIEATGKQLGESARLSTASLSGNEYCVEFAYHMNGLTMGELRLYTQGSGDIRSVIWSEIGDKGNAWFTYSTTVTLGSGYDKIGLEGVRGTDYSGDIAVDDLTVKPGPCQAAAASMYKCGFEADFCSFKQDLSNDIDWTRKTGETPSRQTGPDTGYQGSQYYIYMEVTDRAPGDTASFVTPTLSDNVYCAEFAYHMYGALIGELKLYKEGPGTGKSVIWSESGQKGNTWHTQSSTVTLEPGYNMIGWEGVRGRGYQGDIALDDVTLRSGSCDNDAMDRCSPNPCLNRGVCTINGDSYTCDCSRTGYTGSNCDQQESKDVKCDFENDFCGFVQDTSESLDWTRKAGATPSQQTGPNSGYQRSAYYIYMEATNKQPGDRARISSPSLAGSTVWCVEFAYHMFGNSMGSLSFYLEGPGQRHSWNATGNQGNVWRTWAAQVTADQGQKMTWEAVRGSDYTSDIALDDISIKPERCNVQDIDPCVSNPCLNGGSCKVNADRGSYICECSATEFTGTRCQLDNDPCTNNPCMNGGRCSSNGNAYSCDCSGTSHTGLNCQTDQANDPCIPDPCLNGGRCISPGGAIVCDCSANGYAGNRCEQRPPPVACGKRRQDASVLGPVDSSPVMARIVGGEDSSYGFWPWMALIGYRRERDGKYVLKCGGVIISEEWVMTAAFCVKDLEPSILRVGVGFYDKQSLDSHQKLLVVSRVHIHPDYRGVDTFLDSNIALLRLASPIEWNAYVIPICLPSAGEEPPSGTTCYATGWGETQGTGSDRFLQQAELPLVSLSICNSYYGGNANDKMLCAGDTARSICNGDYGGPLQCRQSDGTYTLYGISSLTGAVDNDCLNAPGLFTKVSRFIKWIEDTKQCTSTFCNGGVCTLRSGAASCDCSNTRYTGDRCQTAIDVCSLRPCSNGGRCIVGQSSSYTCDCTGTGFSGDTCNGGRQCGLAVKRRGSAGALVSSQNQTIGAEITNGVDTEYGEWPWQVTVECRANRTHRFACGGVIISDMWVLSAAHCVKCPDNSQYTVNIADYRIYDYDHSQISRSVSRIVRHPQYTPSVVNDLALFRLSSPLTWSDYIQPVCLPPRKDSDPPPGTECVVTGWGVMFGYTTQRPNIMQEARIPILDISRCNAIYWYSRPFSSKNMCAGDNIRNVCLGDSGGPLQCQDSDGRYTVYGITSRGPPTCDLPGVFSRVSHTLDWITQYI